MTDAILRDEPASTHQTSSSTLLTRCRAALAGLRTLYSRKDVFQGLALDTPLPRISPELIERIIQLKKLNERTPEAAAHKAQLTQALDLDLRSAIGPDLLKEYHQLKALEEGPGDQAYGRLWQHFTTATGYLKDELSNAYDVVKKKDKTLGWALNDIIHSKPQTAEAQLQRIAVDFSLMEAHNTAARVFNHWRNAGAEYIQAQTAASSALTTRAPR